jgi:hypothetical protein
VKCFACKSVDPFTAMPTILEHTVCVRARARVWLRMTYVSVCQATKLRCMTVILSRGYKDVFGLKFRGTAVDRIRIAQ